MSKLARGFSAIGMAVFICGSLGWCAPAQSQGQPLTFSVMGNYPYGAHEVPILQQHVSDHNRYSPAKFMVHLGDILAGDEACDESRYASVANILKGSAVPAYIVPGDNEYNDCSNPSQGWSYWLKHFTEFEKNFCGAPFTEHQSVRPENFAFIMDGVLLIGINLVGGNVHDQNEWNIRMQHDANWVDNQFRKKAAQVRGAVVFAQAGPESSRELFFQRFRQSAAAFRKPVLFMHGNGHAWSQSNPWPETNILKVQINKGGVEQPVQVTATMDSLNLFAFKRNPWAEAPQIYNMPPCVNAGPDQTLASGAVRANLQGEATDDGDPNPPGVLTTTWSKISGPGAVTFGNSHALATTASFNAPGTYILRLRANDGQLQKNDNVKIVMPSTDPTLTIDDVNIKESDVETKKAVFTVMLLNPPVGQTVSVDYQMTAGTATAGSDYLAESGTLSFSNGTTIQTIVVTIINDQIDEPDETLFVNLMNPINAAIADNLGRGVIINDDAPPNAPANLLATITGATTVALSWNDNSNDEDGFKLGRKIGDGTFMQIAVLDSNVTSYNDIGLNPSTVYTYRLRAFNEIGLSTYSNQSTTETASAGVNDPEVNLGRNKATTASSTDSDYTTAAAVDGDLINTHWRSDDVSNASPTAWLQVDLAAVRHIGQAIVRWKDNSYAKSYEMQISTNNLDWLTVYSKTAGASGNQEITFPPAYARYVRLYMTANQQGSYRIYELEIYSGPLTAPPPAPSHLAATATSNSTIFISWNDNSDREEGFKIERAKSGGSFNQIATAGANVTLFNDTGLKGNVTYVYRVRAKNLIGDSGYSNEAVATTPVGSSASDATTNLARNKPTVASKSGSLQPAAYAVDGNTETFWQSGSLSNNDTIAWLRVDLGTVKPIGRALVKWKEGYYAESYALQVSSDTLNWSMVYSTGLGASGSQAFIFPQTTARYVRFYMTENNKNSYRIVDLEVYSGSTSTPKRSGGDFETTIIPEKFSLGQNYPNPFGRRLFNSNTRIDFTLPEAGKVTINIYSETGQLICRLVDDEMAAGRHQLHWNGRNQSGKAVAAGIYLYQIVVRGENGNTAFRQTRRMAFLK